MNAQINYEREFAAMALYMKEWRFLGEVGVDSGQLMVIDPCYVTNRIFSEKQYKDVCGVTREGGGRFNLAETGAAGGVAFTSGFGDGLYGVRARIVEDENGREYIAEVVIELIEPEGDDD